MEKDYYQILGVSINATSLQIKSAYRKLAKKYHPDLNKGSDAEKKMKEINEAYDVLSVRSRRGEYDGIWVRQANSASEDYEFRKGTASYRRKDSYYQEDYSYYNNSDNKQTQKTGFNLDDYDIFDEDTKQMIFYGTLLVIFLVSVAYTINVTTHGLFSKGF